MDPITLATVTAAVTNLALDAGKEIVSDAIKQTWSKVKARLGWTAEPATEDLASEIAKAMAANATTLQEIVADLKVANAGAASRLVSKFSSSTANTTGNMLAGRDNFNFQGSKLNIQGDAKFGGG